MPLEPILSNRSKVNRDQLDFQFIFRFFVELHLSKKIRDLINLNGCYFYNYQDNRRMHDGYHQLFDEVTLGNIEEKIN